jgi:hypothetical protein
MKSGEMLELMGLALSDYVRLAEGGICLPSTRALYQADNARRHHPSPDPRT